jgi:hypothetical protein
MRQKKLGQRQNFMQQFYQKDLIPDQIYIDGKLSFWLWMILSGIRPSEENLLLF